MYDVNVVQVVCLAARVDCITYRGYVLQFIGGLLERQKERQSLR
jgi:hypothetical protein